MRLLELTDIVPIHNDNRYNTYNYEVSTIINYVTSRGYNAFILDPYYSNGGYWIRMFNIAVDNGAIYLLDFNPNVDFDRTGFYGDNAGYSRPVAAQSASQLGDVSVGISWTYESYQDRMYYTFQESISSMHGLEYAFYTTSQYTKVYINNEDVTPVSYTWSCVPAISGKNGILSLARVADDSILTGEGIENLSASDVILSTPAEIGQLGANLPTGETVTALYAGSIDHMDLTRGLNPDFPNYTYDIYVAGVSVFSGSTLGNRQLGFIEDSENEVALVAFIAPHVEAGIQTGYDLIIPSATAEEMNGIYRFVHPHIDGEDPGTNEPDEGTDPDYQPDIAVTGITKPNYGAINTGFTKMYRVADTQLKALASYLWTSDFVTNVKKFFSDPREIIVGLAIMPVIPETGTAETISAGGISTGISGLPLTDQYKFNTEDTTGYAEVKAEKGNFLDYNPYTKVTAHLPFVGSHSLDVNDVMGKRLTLKYIFDFLTGSCVAEIDVNGKPRYFFGGACGIQVPTSSEDFSRMYSGIISAGASIGSLMSSMATGGLTAPLAIGTAANLLTNAMNSSPTVEYTSGSGSVNGMIGCKTAFITVEKPKEKVAGEQSKFTGKPSYIKRKLKSCTGYTKCFSVHLDNVPCTGQERSELERLLTAGVRIGTSGSTTPSYTPSEPGMHGIIFMKLYSDMDVIGKTWKNTTELIEGKLMFDQSMLKPKFIVNGNFSAYNYAYIPEFGRFYYIMEQSIKTGTLSEIDMQVDVLQSFKEELIGENADVDAIIERQQSLNNAYFADGMYWTQTNKEVKTYPFTFANGNEMKFDIPSDNFILTIAGGD